MRRKWNSAKNAFILYSPRIDKLKVVSRRQCFGKIIFGNSKEQNWKIQILSSNFEGQEIRIGGYKIYDFKIGEHITFLRCVGKAPGEEDSIWATKINVQGDFGTWVPYERGFIKENVRATPIDPVFKDSEDNSLDDNEKPI